MSDSEWDGEDDASMMSIEVDLDSDVVSQQYDSCYSSATDATSSLFSEVTDYKWENGRRYHAYAEGAYWAPNDDKQNQQLDIYHHVYTLALDGKLFLAPLKDPKNVLDLGTGTGIWAIEMADRFPETQILGNDLSPVQPTWIPANCSFEVDDFTKRWLCKPGSFDFVHSRACYGSVPDWEVYLTEAYNALEPGGWFESVEVSPHFQSEKSPNGSMPVNSHVNRWTHLATEASAKRGAPLDIAGRVTGFLRKTGFVNIQEKQFKIPHGPWPKDGKMKLIGKINCVNVLEAAEGCTLALFTRVLGWTVEDTYEFLNKVIAELKDRQQQFYHVMFVAYGQKPLNADPPLGDGESGYFSGKGATSFVSRASSSH